MSPPLEFYPTYIVLRALVADPSDHQIDGRVRPTSGENLAPE
jgi:hypothetical protein